MPAPPPTAEGERLAQRLALARQGADLTQAELGAILGYKGTAARQMVGQYERGQVPTAWLRLRALARALNVSADWLLGAGSLLPEPGSESVSAGERKGMATASGLET